jgi:hypothetical protein
VVVHGPHHLLPAGRYRVEVTLHGSVLWSLVTLLKPVILEVAAGARRLAERRARFLLRGRPSIVFDLPDADAGREPVYVRVFRGRFAEFAVAGVRITRLAAADSRGDAAAMRPEEPSGRDAEDAGAKTI